MSVMTDDDFVRLFQRTFGLTEDGSAGRATEGKLRELAALAGVTIPAVPADEIPADYWPMLSRIESADRPYVQAGSSTASGLYQFILTSWVGEGGAWGKDAKGEYIRRPAFGGLKPSAEEQLARAKTFTARNAAVLKARGIPINKASLYAAHFFGAGMAAKVIGADVNARADLIAGPEATRANPQILEGKTVGQFLTWLKGKTGEWAR
jgi:hypothetical protein